MKKTSNNVANPIVRILFWLLILAGAITIFFWLILRLLSGSPSFSITPNPSTHVPIATPTNSISAVTATPTTLSKSIISYGKLVFEENFDVISNSWDLENNRLSSGYLIIGSKNDFVPFGGDDNAPPIYSDFIFESQFSFPKDSIGLEFGIRSQYPPCPGWSCNITIFIDRSTSNIFVYQAEYGEHSGPFASKTFEPKKIEFLPNQLNRLAVITNGTEYEIYINDYYIMKFSNSKYQSGTYLLYNPGTTEVEIDYIRFYELPK